MTSSQLPKTLAELAAFDKLPMGAYVDLPDKSQSWFVQSVQVLPDGFRVNNQPEPIFTGNEALAHYFDVRNFAGVMREILTHLILVQSDGKPASADDFTNAQQQLVSLRQKLEKAYKSALQKRQTDLQIWMLGLEAYVLIVEDGQRLDTAINLSSAKLANHALKRGKELIAEESEVAYFYEKR